jgi:hypothetical protein
MIRYDCYDEYGQKAFSFTSDANTLETVILKLGDKYYRPICHDLTASPNVAKCIPVTVLNCDTEGTEYDEQVSVG